MRKISVENQKQIESIGKVLPELGIDGNDEDGYTWTYRCAESFEVEEIYFDSPVEALANFAQYQSHLFDQIMAVHPNNTDILKNASTIAIL